MRGIFIASLVVAGAFTSSSYGFQSLETGIVRCRKTLGFGTWHPHKVFKSNPHQIQFNVGFVPNAQSDPFEVALRFAEEQTGSKNFYIRQDSYTDKNTGITHVYARQVINGLEILDGDMNINIKDGIILSFGSSFYKGPPPALFEDPHAEDIIWPHTEYCKNLVAEIEAWTMNSGQVVLGQHDHSRLEHLYRSNCQRYSSSNDLFGEEFTSTSGLADFRPALLQFMIVATPRAELADKIHSNVEEYLNKIQITDTSHSGPAGSHMQFAADNVPDAISPVKAKLAYIQVLKADRTTSTLKLVWKFEVEMKDNWYEAALSANAPHRIISVVDWTSDSAIPPPLRPRPSYEVFAWGINDPMCGERTIAYEDKDKLASPVGWHSLPFANDPTYSSMRVQFGEVFRNTTTTWGNNIFAHENWEGTDDFIFNRRPVTDGRQMKFHYKYDPQYEPTIDPSFSARSYINATITQLFYISNKIHDIFYRYGFDEESGNFQQYNFGRGGDENDAIIADAQHGSEFDDAVFTTPPDGENGRMRMYLWSMSLPYRDVGMDTGIVIHELTHGLSARLTGGRYNSRCLGYGESGGLSEGWSDFLATIIRSRGGEEEFPMGSWACNKATGLRNYVYSTNETNNPTRYDFLNKQGWWDIHAIGEVWAEMLWIIAQDLIKVHGYSNTLYPPLPLEDGTIPDGDFFRPLKSGGPRVPKHGNTLFMQLVINAMKLQPCNPTFFEARDAIFQADKNLTGGENFCTIWRGFAKRGLGVDAKVDRDTNFPGGRTNGFAVPMSC